MMASTVEKTTLARPHLSTVKAKQQKEAIKPRIFSFTAEDLYNYLHQKTGNVETINIEECKNKKLEENGTGMDKPSSFCRICNKIYTIRCPVHPPSSQSEPSVPGDLNSYAMKSFPDVVQLCKSSIPGKKYGVSAKQHIPVGTWIGPYEGKRINPEDVKPNMDSSFLWEIYKEGQILYYLDATDENSSSWMRFIKCARHRSEQNLFAFQYCANIYYRAFRDIPIGTELLVWYEDIYPQYFGIPMSIHDLNSMGSRPYPVMATTNTDGHQVSPIPPPTITAVKQASPQLQTSSNRNTPLDSPPTRTAQTPRATEREVHVNKQAQKENIKRKHEESNGINKRAKIQNMPKTDGPKEMLRKLEEARLKDIHDKTELPCEWPRVADGEFILENGEPKIWHCGQCDKSFAQRSLLQMHICARNPNRPYQCGHCSQEFAHPNELRTHAVIHSGKKPFKCGFCSRTFAGATTLNNHVRTHTGERPFTCNKCYKTFSQASQLSKHKRSLYECFPRDKY
nr:putative histone-lysine N-methyltransferase PRDM6 isoform X1 [Pocillopora verrucosa]